MIHQLFKIRGPKTISDLIPWVETEESMDFIYSFSDRPRGRWSTEEIEATCYLIICEANEALQQPLSLSDFIRPDKPVPGEYEALSEEARKAHQEQDRKDLEAWENWEPLFPGFGWMSSHHNRVIVRNPDFTFRISFWRGASKSITLTGKNKKFNSVKTRNDFIHECNRHSIPLGSGKYNDKTEESETV